MNEERKKGKRDRRKKGREEGSKVVKKKRRECCVSDVVSERRKEERKREECAIVGDINTADAFRKQRGNDKKKHKERLKEGRKSVGVMGKQTK